MCRWFCNEATRLYALFGETEKQRGTRGLIEYIQKHGSEITVRELQRGNGKRYRTVEAAEAALGTLVRAGRAEWAGKGHLRLR